MIEIILGAITIGTLLSFSFYVYNDRKQHDKYINAIISKTPQDMFNLDMTDKVKVDTTPEAQQDIPIEDVPDDLYIDLITKESLNGRSN